MWHLRVRACVPFLFLPQLHEISSLDFTSPTAFKRHFRGTKQEAFVLRLIRCPVFSSESRNNKPEEMYIFYISVSCWLLIFGSSRHWLDQRPVMGSGSCPYVVPLTLTSTQQNHRNNLSSNPKLQMCNRMGTIFNGKRIGTSGRLLSIKQTDTPPAVFLIFP